MAQARPIEQAPLPLDATLVFAGLDRYLGRMRPASRIYSEPSDATELAALAGFRADASLEPEVLTGPEVFLELGHPSAGSLAWHVATDCDVPVHDGRITHVGPDLGELERGASCAFALGLLVKTEAGAPIDPYAAEAAMNLGRCFPGLMARTMPGKLWLRISQTLANGGFGMRALGAAVLSRCRAQVSGLVAAEVLLVVAADPAAPSFADLAPLAGQAAILAGTHRRLYLDPSGALACRELDCDACDNRTVCDTIREVTRQYRRQA